MRDHMWKITFSLLFFGFSSVGFGQSGGIRFENGLSWNSLKAKAKNENKYIFVDVFATWCGPCKEMERDVYPQSDVGSFINSNFFSIKVQADKTKNDNASTKLLYKDAELILKVYQVTSFPALLFFSPEGNLIRREGFMNSNDLIKAAHESINSWTNYQANLKEYKAGKIKVTEFKKLSLKAQSLGDLTNARKIATDYIDNYLIKLDDSILFTKSNLEFIGDNLGSSKTIAYNIFKNQARKVNLVLGSYSAQNKILDLIGREYFSTNEKFQKNNLDWDSILKKATEGYGTLGKEKTYEQRMIYYRDTQNWQKFGVWYKHYLENYLRNTSYDPNYLSWLIFEHVDDQKILKFASDTVMTYALERWYANDYLVYDTYANLLYKSGRKSEAIIWEERAVKLSNNEKSLVETLDKMRRGYKTWQSTPN